MEKTHFSSDDYPDLLDRWPFELKSKKIKLYLFTQSGVSKICEQTC